jgi:ComF family protein
VASGPICKLIQGLKYKKLSDEQKFIVDLVANRLDRNELRDFVVTAVPLHFSRRMSRGFNQSKLLGEGLEGRLNLLYKDKLLYRPSKTISQVELDKLQRGKNVRGAFKIYDKAAVAGPKILLVDDVVTTGATVKECAKVLKRGGAKEVWALALAHG